MGAAASAVLCPREQMALHQRMVLLPEALDPWLSVVHAIAPQLQDVLRSHALLPPVEVRSLALLILAYDAQQPQRLEPLNRFPKGSSKRMLHYHYMSRWNAMLERLQGQGQSSAAVRIRLQSVTNVMLTPYQWDASMGCSAEVWTQHYRVRHGLQPISQPFAPWCSCANAAQAGWMHAYSCAELTPTVSRTRHDHIKDNALSLWLRRAMIHVEVEPSRIGRFLVHHEQCRPDIAVYLQGINREPHLLDLTVTAPEVSFGDAGRSRGVYSHAGAAADSREKAKEAKYRELGLLRQSPVVGCAVEIYGAFGRGLKWLVKATAEAAEANPASPYTATEIRFGMVTAITAALHCGLHAQLTRAYHMSRRTRA